MALKGQLRLDSLSSDPTSGLQAGLMYFNTTTNSVRVYDGNAWANAASGEGSIPSSGLELHLDAADSNSYNGSGTTWSDISGNNRHWNVSANSFVSTGIKHFDFSGQYRATFTGGGGGSTLTDVPSYTNRTIIAFSTIVSSANVHQTLVKSLGSDHQVIVWNNGFNLGVYTNAFYDSGYDITSIPDYNTKFNGQFYRLATGSSPYWAVSINGASSNQAQLTFSSSIGSNQGFCVIGQFHNSTSATSTTTNTQSWGKFHAFLYYSRHITFAEQNSIYNYYRTRLGI